jgi:hypothetical protein
VARPGRPYYNIFNASRGDTSSVAVIFAGPPCSHP